MITASGSAHSAMHPIPPTGERYFRTLFEACGEAFFVTNEQGQAIDCNEAALSLFSCQRDDILGTTPLHWSPELQPNGQRSEEWAAEIFSRAATGETVRFEWENRRLDCAPVFVSVTVRRTVIDGQACYLVVSRDISDRKQAENALREEQRLRETIQDAIPGIAYALDNSGAFRFWNRTFEDITGYSAEELMHLSALDLFDGENRVLIAERIKDVFEQGVSDAEAELVAKDGSRRPYYFTGRRIELGGEHIMVGAGMDIFQRTRAEEAILASERRFSQLIQNSYDAFVILDADGMQRYVSPSAERVHGYAPAELVDIPVIERMIHPDDQARVRAAFRQIIETGSGGAQYRHRNKASGWVDLEAFGTNQLSNPDIHGVVINVRDITEQKRTATVLERQVAFNQAIIDSETDGIAACHAIDAPPYVMFSVWNPAMEALTGYSLQEINRLGWYQTVYVDPAIQELARARMDRMRQGDHLLAEEWTITRKDGEKRTVQITTTIVSDSEGIPSVLAIMHDITEQKAYQWQLQQLAHHDTLTDLPNRALLADRMHQAMARVDRNGGRMGIILLDLDGFKWINDSVGHDTGDAVLVTVARRLEGALRAHDTVARLGGDEFVLVVQDAMNVDDVMHVAEKALDSLRDPIDVSGRSYHVSGSAGITLYPDDGEDEQTLIRNADIAMYQAKAAGKNRCQYFAASMQTHALRRMETVSGLRKALLSKEFALYYQPLVDAVTGRIEGAEALIRWQHPQHGMMPPAEFIPVAEESGLIVSIGAWALREALRQMRAWEDSGTPLSRVAVNFSAVPFREAGLCDMASNALLDFGLAPDRLTVEITESVLMDDNLVTAASINGLEMLGVQVALDDFGTGYSSLSALKRFPVDCVKIDRSFVHDCVDDKEDANLITAIIQMAHGLNLKVVAEGVETQEQAELLRAQGCDQLQGYLISKPLPADAVTALLVKESLLFE